MKLSYSTFQLKRKYPFVITGYTQTASTVVFIQIEHEGITGLGEASPGYYLNETPETVISFLTSLHIEQFKTPEGIEHIIDYADKKAPGNTAAKAALDMALHDLLGKMQQRPCYTYFNVNPDTMPATSFTLGMDTPEMIRKKTREAADFKIIKVKLGGGNDKAIIEAVRAETDTPFSIDANQGWKDKHEALEMIHWLHERNTLFIEQPMHKDDREGNAWLTENSPLPVIADEAVQRLADVEKAKGVYHGINIKMVKCSGMREGYRMIEKARELQLKLMIGCMGESSNAIMAAAALAPLCDWVDLDSAWLMSNNPFEAPSLKEGKIILKQTPGLGLCKINL